MVWNRPASECQECAAPLSPAPGRGRPPTYCGAACRQAAYRHRRDALQNAPLRPTASGLPPEPGPDDERLLELARTVQAEFAHLVRILTTGPEAAVNAPVSSAVQILQQVDAILAGTVVRARRHGASWDTVGRLLSISPETARRTFHEQSVRRRFINVGQPADPPAASDGPSPGPPPRDAPPPPAHGPGRSHHRSASQLAPILSRLQRAARIPLRQLGHRAHVSASYLSRVLAGEQFPSWEMTERLGRVLGADLCTLRQIWRDDHRRQATGRMRHATRTSTSTGKASPEATLGTALRALHRRCGSPTPRAITTVLDDTLTPDDIAAALDGTHVPTWSDTQQLIKAMEGDPESFRPLWETAPRPRVPHQPAPPATPAASGQTFSDTSVANLFAIFATVLSSPHPALSHT